MTSKLLNSHCLKWADCSLCAISEYTQEKVLYRGDFPCDVLFIGESPGDTELVMTKPFVGAAGKYLNKLIETVQNNLNAREVAIGFTNAVACGPIDESTFRLRKPSNLEVTNCSKRLMELIIKSEACTLIGLGDTAKKALKKLETQLDDYHVYHGIHPSAILRQGERGYLDQARLTETITDAFKSVLNR